MAQGGCFCYLEIPFYKADDIFAPWDAFYMQTKK